MATEADLLKYVAAVGANRSLWRFADADVRRGTVLRTICRAWEIFLRDAGSEDVGPAYAHNVSSLMDAEDGRRGPMLLWLAQHGKGSIAHEASLLANAVGASRGYEGENAAMLFAAQDVMVADRSRPGSLSRTLNEVLPTSDLVDGLRSLASMVETLRLDPAFAEARGLEVQHRFPRGTFRHYVSAQPGGAWALNLALLTKRSPFSDQLCGGLISRVLFRDDLGSDELVTELIGGAAKAAAHTESLFKQTFRDVARGAAALCHLSRNSRAKDAWLLVSSTGGLRRSQLGKALGLSRAGADLQAHALADAGLVELGPAGHIRPVPAGKTREQITRPIDQVPMASAIANIEADMAAIDRLLERSSTVSAGHSLG